MPENHKPQVIMARQKNRITSREAILKIAFVILVISFGALLYLLWSFLKPYATYTSYLTNIIAGFIATANALLLYSTLKLQQEDGARQRMQFEQEVFEKTFFNLLENFRKLTNDLSDTFYRVSKDIRMQDITVQGLSFFKWAVEDITLIEESIKCSNYLLFDEQMEQQYPFVLDQMIEEGKISNEVRECKEKQHLEDCQIKQITTQYLSKSNWTVFHGTPETCVQNSYKCFYAYHIDTYSVYILALIQILEFIVEKQPEQDAIIKYTKFLQMQITQPERKVIKLHAMCDEKLLQLIETTSLLK